MDLGFIMDALSREQLQIAVMQIVAQYPGAGDILIQAAEENHIDSGELEEKLTRLLRRNAPDTGTLEPFLKQSKALIDIQDADGGETCLQVLTEAVVDWIEQHSEEILEDDQIKTELEQTITELEKRWEELVSLLRKQASELEEVDFSARVKLLSKWQKALSDIFGAVFGEVLRQIKIRKTAKNPQVSPGKKIKETR